MSIVEKPVKESRGLSLIAELTSDDRIKKLAAVLPRHLKVDRFVKICINQLNKNPKLAQCTPFSFFGSIGDLANLGLEPDGRRAHLIPYKQKGYDGKPDTFICQYQLDYKGIAELVMRSGLVSHISADVVRHGDLFVYTKGQLKEHVPHYLRIDKDKPAEEGDVFAVYSLVVMKDGSERVEVMSRRDVLAIRDGSQGWKAFKQYGGQSPWDPKEPHKELEMWKKTAFKRLSKWLPLSSEIRDSFEKEDELEFPEQSFRDQMTAMRESIPLAGEEIEVRQPSDLAGALKQRNAKVAQKKVEVKEVEVVSDDNQDDGSDEDASSTLRSQLLAELQAADNESAIASIEEDVNTSTVLTELDRNFILDVIGAKRAE